MRILEKDFFISYTKPDENWAMWIAAVLEAEGYTCWVQAWDFKPGGNFVLDMQKALTDSKRFIAVLSDSYVASLYCQAEWTAAFTKDPNGEKRRLIPVRVEGITPEGLLAARIYIDLSGAGEEEAERRLISGVDEKDIPRARPPFPGSPKSQAAKVRFPGTLPVNNLPYIRNHFFTEHGSILSDIRSGFESGNAVSLTQSITGMGGLGKTQTALEYAYRYAYLYDLIWWVPAETNATALQSYRQFVKNRKLFKEEPKEDEPVIDAVLSWLNDNEKWLFIYDNADSVTGETAWLPRSTRGNVLFTTRNRTIQIGKKINLSVFTPAEAIAFLEKRTGRKADSADAAPLAGRLGYFPLALEQAAAYINLNQITYADYLALLNDYGLAVLEETDGVQDYNRSVSATFKLSVDRINLPAAKQLLYLCAYFAPENIDPVLLEENAALLPPPLAEELPHKLKEFKLWEALTRYSLLNKQDDGKGYSMHRLLQEAVRAEIGDDETWARCCLAIFLKNFNFEYGNVASHKRFIQLSPHVEAALPVIQNFLPEDKIQERIEYLYSTCGFGNYHLGNYPKALEWYRKALAIAEKVLGTEHPSTATAYNNIAAVYDNQGDYPKALEWYRKALAIREKVLGAEHPSTATAYNNIAGVYDSQGDYPEALGWYQKALAIHERVLGAEHPSTATTYHNIAGVYDDQGDYPKALEWYRKALAIAEKVLGAEHPDTATAYHNIAAVYSNQGDYPKALEWYQKALAIAEKVLGTEHPHTAAAYNNIAMVYSNQGDYPKALEWYRKALAIAEKVLGAEHPSTATTYHNIAGVYDNQGDYPKALEWYQKALPVLDARLGPEHEYTRDVREDIARMESLPSVARTESE